MHEFDPEQPDNLIECDNVMADWFAPGMDSGTYVEATESGFTSNQIAIKWLEHYINNSYAGPESSWKLLLMDNHGSHETPEFIQLANDNHILPFPFPSHMTHCMQPLDVGIFQPYKHWHDKKVQAGESAYGICRPYVLKRLKAG